jgi:transglycosylase-like protein
VRKLLVSVLCVGVLAPVALAAAAENNNENNIRNRTAVAGAAGAHEGNQRIGQRGGQGVRYSVKQQKQESRGAASVEGGPSDSTLAGIRQCESGGDYDMDSGNGFHGAYQFMQSTWEAVGGEGNPAEASPAEQDRRAAILYAQSGSGQWPVCGA